MMIIWWTPYLIYDIYHLNPTMSCQQMEKSTSYLLSCLLLCLSPQSRGVFYPKYHMFTYYCVIEKMLLYLA